MKLKYFLKTGLKIPDGWVYWLIGFIVLWYLTIMFLIKKL